MNWVRLCFSFFGRVNRAQYWIGIGIAYGMMILAAIAFFWLEEPASVYWDWAFGFWVLLWMVALVAVATKRLHDLDISGWWLLGFMIMLILLDMWAIQVIHMDLRKEISAVAWTVGIIWLGSAKGTEGSNRFGPDPIPRLGDKGTTT